MPKGKIKRIVVDRGFGFIRAEDGQDYFFHRSGLKDLTFETMKEGDPVQFDIETSGKGPRAGNVRADTSAVTS